MTLIATTTLLAPHIRTAMIFFCLSLFNEISLHQKIKINERKTERKKKIS